MREFIIWNSCDWSGAAGWPGREGYPEGGQPWPSQLQPGCTDCHGSSSHTVQVSAPWPSPRGCRDTSAPTTKAWDRSKCGPQCPACHQEFRDQVCWQQNWAGPTELPSLGHQLCCTDRDCACPHTPHTETLGKLFPS